MLMGYDRDGVAQSLRSRTPPVCVCLTYTSSVSLTYTSSVCLTFQRLALPRGAGRHHDKRMTVRVCFRNCNIGDNTPVCLAADYGCQRVLS